MQHKKNVVIRTSRNSRHNVKGVVKYTNTGPKNITNTLYTQDYVSDLVTVCGKEITSLNNLIETKDIQCDEMHDQLRTYKAKCWRVPTQPGESTISRLESLNKTHLRELSRNQKVITRMEEELVELNDTVNRLEYKLNLLENPPSKNRIVYNFIMETKDGNIDTAHIGNKLVEYCDVSGQNKIKVVLVEDDGTESVVCDIKYDSIVLVEQEPVVMDGE